MLIWGTFRFNASTIVLLVLIHYITTSKKHCEFKPLYINKITTAFLKKTNIFKLLSFYEINKIYQHHFYL